MRIKTLIILLIISLHDIYSQDSLKVISVNLVVSYKEISGGSIKKTDTCDNACLTIKNLNVEIADANLLFWQNLLKFIEYEKGTPLIGGLMCGGPAFTWKIILKLKNHPDITLYTNSDRLNLRVVNFLNDKKNRYLFLDEYTHNQFRERLIQMLVNGLKFNAEEIDCGC